MAEQPPTCLRVLTLLTSFQRSAGVDVARRYFFRPFDLSCIHAIRQFVRLNRSRGPTQT